jgi:outer membrane protein assembly factor BamE
MSESLIPFRRAAARRLFPVALLAGLLTACGPIRPYTLEIQQGIVLDQKMIARLKAGMTRNQVGLALGTPLLADPLHADRWDYVYYTRHRGTVGEWRRLTLTFKDDRLAAITGDVTVASADDAPATVAEPATAPAASPSSGLPAPAPDQPGPSK